MDRSVARLNIDHFRKLLQSETDDAKRAMLQKLLAEQEAKLERLGPDPGEKSTKLA
jgi:hypothetical protein